jgi:hypothetical protein
LRSITNQSSDKITSYPFKTADTENTDAEPLISNAARRKMDPNPTDGFGTAIAASEGVTERETKFSTATEREKMEELRTRLEEQKGRGSQKIEGAYTLLKSVEAKLAKLDRDVPVTRGGRAFSEQQLGGRRWLEQKEEIFDDLEKLVQKVCGIEDETRTYD